MPWLRSLSTIIHRMVHVAPRPDVWHSMERCEGRSCTAGAVLVGPLVSRAPHSRRRPACRTLEKGRLGAGQCMFIHRLGGRCKLLCLATANPDQHFRFVMRSTRCAHLFFFITTRFSAMASVAGHDKT